MSPGMAFAVRWHRAVHRAAPVIEEVRRILHDLIFAAKLILLTFAAGALTGTFLLGCRSVLGWPG